MRRRYYFYNIISIRVHDVIRTFTKKLKKKNIYREFNAQQNNTTNTQKQEYLYSCEKKLIHCYYYIIGTVIKNT